MAAFDWPVLMEAGLRGLGLTPQDFWALTPAELRLMLGPENGRDTMSRAGFERLMAAYPDQKEGPQNG